jgi:SAM-dependent methyltransferase
MSSRAMDYRSRLYQHYLSTHDRPNLGQIQQDLKHRAPYLKQLIRRWIPEDRFIRILDLGCGYGALLYFLKESGYCYLSGVDRSPEQVMVARQLEIDAVQEGDVLDFLRKKEDHSYDVVIAFDILEHFTKQEIFIIVDEIYRVMQSKGKLILHVPNGEGIFSGRIYFGDLTHQTAFTCQSIHQLMSAVGFTRIDFVEDTPVVHGVKSGTRYVLWKVFRSLFRLIYMAETGDTGRGLILTQNLIAVVEKE